MAVLGARPGLEVPGLAGQVLVAPALLNIGGGVPDGVLGDAQGVGPHIGDKADGAHALHLHALVQLLGGLHGAPGLEAQLAAGLLLQGRGDKGRGGRAVLLALLHGGDQEVLLLQLLKELVGLLLGADFDLAVLVPVKGGGEHGLAGGRGELGVNAPVLLGHKGLDFLLPIYDHPHGHALHPARGKPPADGLGQKGAEGVAHQPVQDAAGLLGVDQIQIDGPGVGHALLHAGAGDLVKGDAVRGVLVQAQNVGQVPGDGLPLPVRVGGKQHAVGVGGGLFQLFYQLLLAFYNAVFGLEVVLHVHAETRLGQVPHVAHRGHHLVLAAQIFLNGFRLCRRLHDH